MNTFKLSFITDQNKIVEIEIPRANIMADVDMVKSAMDRIIASGVTVFTEGDIRYKENAKLIRVSPTTFNI